MPLITTSHYLPEGLAGIKHEGDKTKFLHVENVEPVAQECKNLRKQDNNGFSKKKTMRQIAYIPELVFLANPQLTDKDGRINRKELRKFLRSPQGSMFRTVDKGF